MGKNKNSTVLKVNWEMTVTHALSKLGKGPEWKWKVKGTFTKPQQPKGTTSSFGFTIGDKAQATLLHRAIALSCFEDVPPVTACGDLGASDDNPANDSEPDVSRDRSSSNFV